MNGFAALLGVMLAAPGLSSGTGWLDDYGEALRQAKQARVPLLIVLDDPTHRFHRIEQVAFKTDRKEETALLQRYKLCHVDIRTEYGQRVAKAFKTTEFPHTVIIDRTGARQIYKKTGRFTDSQWIGTLAAYKTGLKRAKPVYRLAKPCFT